jgi:hypothetical protein
MLQCQLAAAALLCSGPRRGGPGFSHTTCLTENQTKASATIVNLTAGHLPRETAR